MPDAPSTDDYTGPLRGAPNIEPTRLAEMRWRFGLLHLACLAALLHLGTAATLTHTAAFLKAELFLGLGLLGCSTVIFLLELADDSSSWTFRRMLGVLLPCAALPARSGDGRSAYFPSRGWLPINVTLERSLEASFAGPMIAAALVIVPLLAIEHWGGEYVAAHGWLTLLLALAHATIWAAFTFEFAIRCNVAADKWAYIRRHWLDALIILMPLVAFLRMARLGQLARLQQTTRMFRLKGVLMRAWRGIILVDVLGRLLDRECDRRAIRLRNDRSDLMRQLDRIDTELAELEHRHAA